MRISLLFVSLFFFLSCKNSEESLSQVKSETYTKSFHEGIRLKLLGNYEKATQLFTTCLKEAPNDDASHFALAQISLIKGDLEQAKYHTMQAASLDNTNLYYQIELGYMYRETGDYEKSANVFEVIINKRSTNANYYYECALSWELLGNLKKAISILDLLEKNIGTRVEASIKKHEWYKGLSNLKEAENELLEVLKKEPNNQYIIATLVDFYLNLGKIGQGMEYLNALVDLDPKNGYGLILLAQFEVEKSNLKKAAEYYNRAILSENIKTDELREALGFLKEHKNDSNLNSILKLVKKSYNDNDTILQFLGDIYIQDKALEDAVNCFELATEINPGSYSNWERLLYLLYDSKNWGRLIEKGQTVVKTFPLKSLPYYMLSVALNQNGQFSLAQRYAKEGLFTLVDDSILRSDLQGQIAESYFGLGLFSEAKKEYIKAIETAKENDYLKFNFCLRLYENNVYLDLGLSMIQELISKNGTNFDLELLKGDLNFKKEEYVESEIIFIGLLEKDQSSPVVNERLGDVYAKQNNITKAMFYWKTAQKLGAERDLLDKKIKNEAFFE